MFKIIFELGEKMGSKGKNCFTKIVGLQIKGIKKAEKPEIIYFFFLKKAEIVSGAKLTWHALTRSIKVKGFGYIVFID